RAQLAQQPPFAERAHSLSPGPEVMIVDEARDEAAAAIVPQYPGFGAVRDDQHLAATRGLERDGTTAPPLRGVEPSRERRLGALAAHEHDVPPVRYELLVGVHRRASEARAERSVSTARSTMAGVRSFMHLKCLSGHSRSKQGLHSMSSDTTAASSVSGGVNFGDDEP